MYRLIYEGSGSGIDKQTARSIRDDIDNAIASSTDAPDEELTVFKEQPQDERLSITIRVSEIPSLSDADTQLNQLDNHFSTLNDDYDTDFPAPSDESAHRLVTMGGQ